MELSRPLTHELKEPVPGLAMYIPDSGVTSASLTADRQPFSIGPGSAYFYSADAGPYRASMQEAGTYSGLKVFLRADTVGDVQTQAARSYVSDPGKPVFSEVPIDSDLLARIALLPKLVPVSLNNEMQALADLNQIVADALSSWVAVELGDQPEPTPKWTARIEAADHYLRTHLADPPSVLELANIVGLNHMTMKRGFRKTYGTTVYGRLRYRRIEHAKARLADGVSVTDTALEVGYANPSKFAAAFRRETGHKPSET